MSSVDFSFVTPSLNSVSETGSVTCWIRQFQDGNDDAATLLWDYYFERLVKLARRKMGITPKQLCDEEDLALSAFKSLCNGVKRGGVDDDIDRDHLWKLMTTITLRKIYDYIKFSQRQKRNPFAKTGQRIVNFQNQTFLNELISREPDPRLNAQLDDQFQQLLMQLSHVDLQKIAVLKMEGYTNLEIARELGRGLSTIERKLRTIRKIWQHKVTS